MPLQTSTNVTFDLYHLNGDPSAPGNPPPDLAGQVGHLSPDWVGGNEHGDRHSPGLMWTHILLVDYSLDIRDYYNSQNTTQANWQDNLFIPDKTGTKFRVIFVEVAGAGAAGAHKRVYLDRQTPNWPTNQL